jgi:hypothetical protein
MSLHIKKGADMYNFKISIIAGVLISLAASAYADEYFPAPRAQLIYGFYHQAVCDDFDNDGDIDIVALHPSYSGIQYVSLILNDGECNFSPIDSIIIGERGMSIHLRDLNGDGHNDVVFTRIDNAVGVLLNNGDGSFQPIHYFGCTLGAGWVTSVDLDNDGDYDLITAGDSRYISVLKNNGDGSFDPYEYYDMGYNLNQIISADFDNDGDLDLATESSEDDLIFVIMNSGDGTINTPVIYQTPTYPVRLAAGDVNNDNYADLAVVKYDHYIGLFVNNGDGSFQRTDSIYIDYQSPVSSICIADINNDGYSHLFLSSLSYGQPPDTPDKIYCIANNGDGTFSDPNSYGMVENPLTITSWDFNNDNYLDILITGINYVFMINNGDGTFPFPDRYEVPEWPRDVIATDLSQDNYPDLAIANSASGTILVFNNNGDGTFNDFQEWVLDPGDFSLAAADFDDNGINDLAVASYSGDSVLVMFRYGPDVYVISGILISQSPRQIITVDIDNDGDQDLATANNPSWSGINSTISIISNDNGAFYSATDYTVGHGSTSICAADFNNDNFADLAVTNQSDSTVSILLNNADGTFYLAADYFPANCPTSVCAGDFDNDLDIDLAITDFCNNGVSVLMNNGNGSFMPPDIYYNVGYNANSIVAFDLEMDGDMDLATIAATDFNILSILVNNGDATFQDAVNYAIGAGLSSICAADLDDNGMTDLAIVSMFGIYVNVLLNQLIPPSSIYEPYSQFEQTYEIMSVYPNPFNNRTTIKYQLPRASHVKVIIYDILGRNIATLIDAGHHQINWDATDYASGLYFSRIQTNDRFDIRKMILMK